MYFKMESLSSAKAAYKVLHGSWFKGEEVEYTNHCLCVFIVTTVYVTQYMYTLNS